jgi:hypothetical protein
MLLDFKYEYVHWISSFLVYLCILKISDTVHFLYWSVVLLTAYEFIREDIDTYSMMFISETVKNETLN